MENEVEPKLVVPIVAGNTKILGLGTPEWAASMILFVIFMSFAGKLFWLLFISQIVGTVVYVSFLAKLEENIIMVLIRAAKIPSIIYGSFNKPMPLDQKEDKNDLFKVGSK
jgi:hypothetical protein